MLRVVVARMLLTMAVSLVVWSLLPAVVGWTPRVIMSGSMEPKIVPGDIIVTRTVPAATLTAGQVVTVLDPDHPGRTRTHRLVRRDAEGQLVLRGDANGLADSSHVDPGDVQGLGVLRVPFVGRPVVWLSERNYVALLGLGLVGSWCVLIVLPRSRGRSTPPDAPTGPRDSSSRTRPRRSRVAAVVAVATAGAVTVAGPADAAAFRRLTSNPVSTLGAASTFHPYRTAVLADSPSFFWRLDETSGTVVGDASSPGRKGTLLGADYEQGQAGALATEPDGRSLALDVAVINANAAVTAPTTFSVEAWVKTTSTTGGRVLGFGNATGQNPSKTVDRQLYLAPNGKVMFGIGTQATALASDRAVNDNAWHHVVGTYTPGSNGMRLYVDGVLQNSTRATVISMSGYWRAGAEELEDWPGNPQDEFYDGSLDELAVYPSALSQARVQAHYQAARTP